MRKVRIPSLRLCPLCSGLVEIKEKAVPNTSCKNVDACPHCGKGFCAYCLTLHPAPNKYPDSCGGIFEACKSGPVGIQQIR